MAMSSGDPRCRITSTDATTSEANLFLARTFSLSPTGKLVEWFKKYRCRLYAWSPLDETKHSSMELVQRLPFCQTSVELVSLPGATVVYWLYRSSYVSERSQTGHFRWTHHKQEEMFEGYDSLFARASGRHEAKGASFSLIVGWNISVQAWCHSMPWEGCGFCLWYYSCWKALDLAALGPGC